MQEAGASNARNHARTARLDGGSGTATCSTPLKAIGRTETLHGGVVLLLLLLLLPPSCLLSG